MGLLRFVARRLGFIVVSLLMVSAVTFLLMEAAPGDFLDVERIQREAQGTSWESTQHALPYWQEKFNPEYPVYKRYYLFMKDAVVFKFGPSFRYPRTDIETIISAAFPTSASLAFAGVALAVVIGVPLGILAALRRNTWVDYLGMFLSMLGQVIPAYVIAVFLMFFFSLWLRWLPTQGWGEPKHLIMPVISLALAPIGTIARYVRSSLLDALKQDYIRTAWAKGGNYFRVVVGHALRNSLIPLITVLGPQLGALMIGTVFVEGIFRIPGLGTFFAGAAQSRDYPMLVTSTLFYAAILMLMNLAVDVAYRFLNPRIQFD